MRLIDADELKTAFPACDNSKPVLVACVRATINHMPTIEPSAQPPWIPCSEETPKENGFYLLSSGGTVLIAYYSDGEWLSELPLIMTENNTAWMPLPQPYGAETERTMEEFMYGQDLGSPEDGSL